MKPVRIFMLSAVLISVVAVSGQQGASGGSSPADILYAQPGQLVSVNGFRLNVYCMGSGSPTVVFDSGWGDWAPAWSKVQPQVAKWTRACSYDRAGTGFSDPGPMPRTSVRIAKELRTALHHAGIAGPYILVGSAFGGDNVRTFADLYMGEVAGLVLVDADPTDVEPKAMREEEHRRHAGIPSDLRDCRNAIVEHKLLPAPSPGQPQQTCAQQLFFRGLPEAEWSPELNAKVLEIAQTKVAMYDAYSSEMEQTASDETYLQQHRRSFGSRPIRVLTSGNHGVGHLERKPPDTPEHLKYERETTLAQARWLGLSSNAKQIFARNSSEYIQFDEPETVINAIREVFDQGSARESPPRVVDLKASDGTLLKASYFAAAKPGPGVLLFHQSNRTRDSWEGIARQLAAAGINTLTVDTRGRRKWPGDLDTAFEYLVSQPGVKRDTIGVGGAGALGVDNSVETARRHPAEVKSLALLSGETVRDGLQFLHESPQLPELFVVDDNDEYPPTVEAMELLYITASNPGRKFVHYSAIQDAPWIWYEPFDIGKVPANGGHGTDMFNIHPELPGIIVNWFVTTQIKTPGHAPADTVASAQIINQIQAGGIAQATQQLMEARRKDAQAQLFPEITVSIIGQDHMRAGEPKLALEVFKLNLLAYPDSADANGDLAGAFLANGEKDLARQYAEKALSLLDSHASQASSWSDTEPRRAEIRRDVQNILKKLSSTP